MRTPSEKFSDMSWTEVEFEREKTKTVAVTFEDV